MSKTLSRLVSFLRAFWSLLGFGVLFCLVFFFFSCFVLFLSGVVLLLYSSSFLTERTLALLLALETEGEYDSFLFSVLLFLLFTLARGDLRRRGVERDRDLPRRDDERERDLLRRAGERERDLLRRADERERDADERELDLLR